MSETGSAGAEGGGRPDTTRPGARFPVLSWLLTATVVGLLLSLAVRGTSLMEANPPSAGLVEHVPPPPVALSAIDVEPGAGPPEAKPKVVEPPTASAAASPSPRLDVLEEFAAELRRHQATLIERERAIGVREAVVTTVEARVHSQLDKLDTAKREIERLLDQVTAEERARVAQLVKVYEAMKAKSAAMIFDPMALELLLPIVRGMRETKVAAIIAEMDPAKARALTTALVRSPDLTMAP